MKFALFSNPVSWDILVKRYQRGGLGWAYLAWVNPRPQDGVDHILGVIFPVGAVEVKHH